MNLFKYSIRQCYYAVLLVTAMFSASAAPIIDVGFEPNEGYRAGQLGGRGGWLLEEGEARIVNEGYDGGRALKLIASDPSAVVSLDIADRILGDERDKAFFVDFYARPAASKQGGFARVWGAGAGMVKVDGDGEVYALDGNGDGSGTWGSTGVLLPVTLKGAATYWHRFTYRIDPVRSQWDLYVDEQMVSAGLGFTRDGEYDIVFFGGDSGPAYFDEISFTWENPLFDDTDSDGLPDSWQGFLSPGGRLEDPDMDGLSNVAEYILGSDPIETDSDGDGVDDGEELLFGGELLVADQQTSASGIVWEFWEVSDKARRAVASNRFLGRMNLPTGQLERFIREDGFLATDPVSSLPLSYVEMVGEEKGAVASRVQGWLIAPVSGEYEFWVSGDDQVEFWLGDASGAPSAEKLAWAQSYTGFRKWTSGQPGGARKTLVAGEKYYFELRHFDAKRNEYAALAWAIPGLERSLVSGRHVLPYAKFDGDLDRDGLPDEWEESYGISAESGLGEDGFYGDADKDGLINGKECRWGYNPTVADSEGARGLVIREVWEGIPGVYLGGLRRNESFPKSPSWTGYLDSLSVVSDFSDDYGQRLRACLVPPETGEYEFLISGDDECELWIAEGESKFDNKVRIAHVPGYTKVGQFFRYPSQLSAPLLLEEGKFYHIEVLHKEARSNDHVEVAWIPPGAEIPEPVPSEYLVCPGPSQLDKDGDDIPDAWAARYGIGAVAPEIDADGKKVKAPRVIAPKDKDGDGFSDEEEYRMGTSPVVANRMPESGCLQCEVWGGKRGAQAEGAAVAELMLSREPDITSRAANADIGGFGDGYLCRLRGYFVPPHTADYRFRLSGDDSADLWLSTGDDPFDRKLLARLQYAAPAGQPKLVRQSSVVSLQGGQRYYIEIMHKQHVGDDYVCVEYKVFGGLAPEIHRSFLQGNTLLRWHLLSGDVIQPYRGNALDKDDTGLPDAWEEATGLAGLTPAECNALADPDRDGLDNLGEFQQGRKPLEPESSGVGGYAKWEFWGAIPGRAPAELLASPRYPAEPDDTALIRGAIAPAWIADSYGARLRAFIVPESSGSYEFAVIADEACQLFLSKDRNKFAKRQLIDLVQGNDYWKWNGDGGKGISKPVNLVAGETYYLEVLHKERHSKDHLRVGWSKDGSGFDELPNSVITSYTATEFDRDDDELPDGWEAEHNLDTSDNGLLDPNAGYWGDPDADSVPNHVEYAKGTDPNSADSDGDGLGDALEINLLGTDPNEADSAALREVLALSPSVINSHSQDFTVVGEELYGSVLNGWFEYPFTLKDPGLHLFELDAIMLPEGDRYAPAPFHISVDGIDLGLFDLSTASERTFVSGLLPYLAAGDHVIRFRWENIERGRSLLARGLKIIAISPGDPPTGWFAEYASTANSLEAAPPESLTSPAWIEGNATFPSLVALALPGEDTDTRDGEILVLPDTAWGANIPLDETGLSTPYQVTYENGVSSEEGKITWSACNIVERDGHQLTVRVGDSLRLNAFEGKTGQGQSYVLAVGKEIIGDLADGETIVHAFAEPGEFDVQAIVDDELADTPTSYTLKVIVRGSDFGAPVLLSQGHTRIVNFPNVVRKFYLATGSRLAAGKVTEGARTLKWRLLGNREGTFPLIARVVNEGPVMALGQAEVVNLRTTADGTSTRIVQTLEDGTRIIEIDFVIGDLPEGARILIETRTSGVVFEDGSTALWISAQDLDENGVYTARFLRGPGGYPKICHSVTLYDGDVVVPLN
ncbi:PA14 domain-containing protein [Verrucomicrobiales bacterium]|nr:PA14 domain-containing protein [Verrucomicrobiales bacterium]